MVNLMDLASDIQSVQRSFKEDGSSPVSSLTIGGGRTTCLLDTDFFLKNFEEFDVSKSSSQMFPITLATNFEGIKFKAYVSIDELNNLMEFVPIDWLDHIKSQQQPETMRVSKGGV